MDWQRLFLPRYWIQNDPTDYAWDAALNAALDEYPVLASDYGDFTYRVKVGPFCVWVGNWPYAYGSRHGMGAETGLPKVATRKRLRAAVEEARRSPRSFMDELAAYRELSKEDSSNG